MACQPGQNLRVLVGGIVVQDDVDLLAGRDRPIDRVQEADELLVAVALHVPADDLSGRDLQRGEQGGGAVALVVVGHGRRFPGLHRQAWLGAVQSLDLGLLVDGQDDRILGRGHIEADDVDELVRERRIPGALEGPDTLRCQLPRLPDPLDRAQADVHGFGHGASGPVGGLGGRRLTGLLDDLRDDLGRGRRCAGLAGLVAQEPVDALLGIALLPAPDSRTRAADLLGDLEHLRFAVGGQHDLSALDVLERTRAIGDDVLQTSTIVLGEQDADGLTSHAGTLTHLTAVVNHLSASVH